MKQETKKTWSKRGQNGSKAPALTPEELEFMGIKEWENSKRGRRDPEKYDF